MDNKIQAAGFQIDLITRGQEDYVSLTDIAKYRSSEPKDVIKNWMRTQATLEYLGLWEELNNPNFNRVDFDPLLLKAGSNAFTMSPQRWIREAGAIGMTQKLGRGGGTFAHTDIAFEFASWVSPEFKLYIIKDYQRLKKVETPQGNSDWAVKRMISKTNYLIHTDAIKESMADMELTKKEINFRYATEADMLNVAVFGKRAAQWRNENKGLQGNIRDYANINQLIVLSNTESMNAELIRLGIPMNERLDFLNKMAIRQMKSLIKEKALPESHQKNLSQGR